MIERIIWNGALYAIILRNNYKTEGIEFFTESHFSQQLGYMNRPKGYVVQAHSHKELKREVINTQEVLVIKSGKVRVDFFNMEQVYITSSILEQGDVILLASGGHGFEMLENTEIIEIKQGPYHGDSDKVIFGSPNT
jgi:hypothetical protein